MHDEILAYIYERQKTQKKKIESFFERAPQAKLDLITFLNTYAPYFECKSMGAREIADTYIELVQQALGCRAHFVRTGEYPLSSQNEALLTVYNQPKLMSRYMIGLALSQFLWEHHYRLFNFFKSAIASKQTGKQFLEIGCGVGLHLLHIIDSVSKDAVVDVVDISQTSIDISKEVLRLVQPEVLERVTFTVADIMAFESQHKYDLINMGEVLEHVEKPDEILEALRPLLKSNGTAHVTTCANCPTIDHVYHYKDVEDIRIMLREKGFSIQTELVAPSVDKSAEYLSKHKVDVSYGAIIATEVRN